LAIAAGWKVEVFASASEFMQCLPTLETACVVLDMSLPDLSGSQLHEWMTVEGYSVPVVFLTGQGDIPSAVQAMKRGALDFLLKPVDTDVLLETIRHAFVRHAAEEAWCQRRQDIKARHARLTSREREVMAHVVDGRLNKQIASDLGISLKTVKVHRARAMEKMEVHSVAALVHLCEAAGL
jgi:FixJ family two-component response regulator